jgi:hypothetical protein
MSKLADVDLPTLIADGPLAHAIEESVLAALACPFAHLTDGQSVRDVLQRSLDAAVRDISQHPQGVLFRRLVEYGIQEQCCAEEKGEDADGPLTKAECERCMRFVKYHMVNRFKGDLAELLALLPCIELTKQLKSQGQLPSSIQLYFGEIIQERARKTRAASAPGVMWENFRKGADGLLIGQSSTSQGSTTSSLGVHGVIEVKSMPMGITSILAQIANHVTRLSGGLKLSGTLWPADRLRCARGGPWNLCHIVVVPSTWRLSREWERIRNENGADQLIVKHVGPPQKTRTAEVTPFVWKITLEWSHEALEAAAYEMTFWYMSRAGMFVLDRKGLPASLQEMTVEQAGYNIVKEMLYHLVLRRLSAREDAIAIRLYNVYSFGYSLGVDSREMLWPEDFSEKS